MTKYNISYQNNGIYQAILVEAKDEAHAKAYFEEHKPTAEVVGCKVATRDDERPGKPVLTVPEDYHIETAAEKTARENWEHCKSIAENLELYTEGNGYKCPHCGEVHEMTAYEESEHENENGETCYTCPNCSEEIEESELEAVSIYDFFNDDIYDLEYRIGSDRQYRSVRVMVACGGPNIYIDTARKAVLLYWWTDHAEYSLLSSTCEAIDQYFEELFNC